MINFELMKAYLTMVYLIHKGGRCGERHGKNYKERRGDEEGMKGDKGG